MNQTAKRTAADIVNGYSKPSVIRLPQSYVNTFLDREDSIYQYDVENLLTKRAVVEVTAEDVREAAPLRSTTLVPRGHQATRSKGKTVQNGRHDKKHKNARGGKNSRRERSQSVTVKSGQTLSQIARKNHTTVDKLKRLNGIKGNNIRAGKKLKVK
jgi:membrane-bound lytic murein transglycosylase D